VKRVDIRVEETGRGVLMAVVGDLDLATVDEAERRLREIEGTHPAVIVLDLSQLEFLDSTGLRVILSADGRARKDGRRLEIVPGPERVHRVFRIALLDQRLTFVDPARGEGVS
jgi:anti-sigma B factor antagonist